MRYVRTRIMERQDRTENTLKEIYEDARENTKKNMELI
jgi:hypothetical protein